MQTNNPGLQVRTGLLYAKNVLEFLSKLQPNSTNIIKNVCCLKFETQLFRNSPCLSFLSTSLFTSCAITFIAAPAGLSSRSNPAMLCFARK